MSKLRSRPLQSSVKPAVLGRVVLILLGLTLLHGEAPAQRPSVSLRTELLTSVAALPRPLEADSTMPSGGRSPAVATILSAVLPGSGQIYVQRYWTVPLIWGFGYWFVRNYIQLDRKYDEWAVKYRQALAGGTLPPAEVNYYRDLRDFYHNERDRFAFYLVITYVLNVVDAYVGASLFSFDVSEDLGGGTRTEAQIRIPLR